MKRLPLRRRSAVAQPSSHEMRSYLEGRWEGKGTYVFYLELVTDLLHLCVYVVFFFIVFTNYGLPLHLVCSRALEPRIWHISLFFASCVLVWYMAQSAVTHVVHDSWYLTADTLPRRRVTIKHACALDEAENRLSMPITSNACGEIISACAAAGAGPVLDGAQLPAARAGLPALPPCYRQPRRALPGASTKPRSGLCVKSKHRRVSAGSKALHRSMMHDAMWLLILSVPAGLLHSRL